MTKEEANNKVIEINSKREKMFCPVIKSMCRIDCACYVIAEVQIIKNKMAIKQLNQPENYEIVGGFCDCYLLVGVMDVIE